MKYAIFADMHSNLEAYQAVLEKLKKEKPSKYFCVGDIVGYGADPVKCVEITKALNPVSVCGNHDWAVASLANLENFNPYAKDGIVWTKEAVADKEIDFLKRLELVHEDDELTLVHGSLFRPEEFNYVIDMYSAYKMLEMARTNISFIAHSHIPGIFVMENGKPGYATTASVKIKEGRKYLVNVGSVGQPRDGDPRGAYCIYDKGKKTLEIKRVKYDIKKAQKKILDAGLPELLAHRLREGR